MMPVFKVSLRLDNKNKIILENTIKDSIKNELLAEEKKR